MKRRNLFYVLAAVVVASSLAFQLSSAIKSGRAAGVPKTLTVAITDNYYPFSYITESGEREGFNLELARDICSYMKADCAIVPMHHDDVLRSLKDKTVDIAIAGLSSTPERQRYLAFSEEYYRSMSIFITNDPALEPIEKSDKTKLRIGVIRDSLQQRLLQKDYGTTGITIVPFETHPEIYKAIETDEINVMLTEGLPAYALLKSPEGQNLHIAGNYPDNGSLAEGRIAVHRDNENLMIYINAALIHLQATGRYQELTLKYFPAINY